MVGRSFLYRRQQHITNKTCVTQQPKLHICYYYHTKKEYKESLSIWIIWERKNIYISKCCTKIEGIGIALKNGW